MDAAAVAVVVAADVVVAAADEVSEVVEEALVEVLPDEHAAKDRTAAATVAAVKALRCACMLGSPLSSISGESDRVLIGTTSAIR